LWRPGLASYDAFAEHLTTAGSFPTYLPWPMSPGWHVTDFGVVGRRDRALATVTCCSGTSELDGAVDVLVASEEPGTGLGARCAGTRGRDPGPEVGEGVPTAHVRIGGHEAALWSVSTSQADADFDRAVRDPADPRLLGAAYDSGDHLHPNDAGMKAFADSIDLSELGLGRGCS